MHFHSKYITLNRMGFSRPEGWLLGADTTVSLPCLYMLVSIHSDRQAVYIIHYALHSHAATK